MSYKYLGLLLTVILQNLNLQSQDKDLGKEFRLEKVITFKVPNREQALYSLCRFRSGKLYILTENFIGKQNTLLFREDLNSGKRDTFFLDAGMDAISDFNVVADDVIMLVNGSFLCYNLEKKHYSKIFVPGVVGYQHFYPKNRHTVYMYEWLIGDRYEERKDVVLYNLESDSFSLLYPLTLTGINFTAIYRGNKYMDIRNSVIARGKASAYAIALRRIESGKGDTLRRNFISSEFISESFIEKLHSGYTGKRMFSVFDSLDEHCKHKRMILSVKLSSDSMLYVHHQNRSSGCDWFRKTSIGYLDVWSYDGRAGKWKLQLSDVRPDNRAVCAKVDWKHLPKNMISFNLKGLESEWMVDRDLLLIPKLLPGRISLDGDLSTVDSHRTRKGPYNLHVFVFRLK